MCASVSLPDILLLGVLCDGDTLAVGFELMLDDFSVGIVLYTESVVQDTSDVIVPEERGGGRVRERRLSREGMSFHFLRGDLVEQNKDTCQ